MSIAEKAGRKPGAIDSLNQFTSQARDAVAKHTEVIKKNVLDLIDLERTPEAKFYGPGKGVIFNKKQTRQFIDELKLALRE